MTDNRYTVKSIGQVQADEAGFGLLIAEPYREALTELEGFSHVNVLWWSHLLDDPMFREMTVAERPYRNAPARIGIFATRSPARPTPRRCCSDMTGRPFRFMDEMRKPAPPGAR